MTLITGHRGARNLWPENSLTGFRNAITLGVDAIEFDVHLTRSGELVVIHDATLERTAEGAGPGGSAFGAGAALDAGTFERPSAGCEAGADPVSNAGVLQSIVRRLAAR